MEIKGKKTLWSNIISQRPNIKNSFNFHQVTDFIQRRPLLSFGISLLVLLGLILLSSLIFKPKASEQKKVTQLKEIKVYSIGSVPKIRIQAQVEKSGVIKIVSLTGGVVQSINVEEGQMVDKGGNLLNLASNYQGGNAALIQTSIAAKQAQLADETFDTQKEIIDKQKDVANQTESNAAQLRDISSKSLSDTNSLIDLNQGILDTLNSNLTDLQTANASPSAILQTKQLVSQFQSAQLQLKASQRNLDFQSNANNPPAKLATLQKEITLRQLDVQEKSLQLNRDISHLQVALASINASLFHPVAPLSGTVERIYVREGQAVSPGSPLLLLSGESKKLSAVAKVPAKVAKNISTFETSNLLVGNNVLTLNPSFVSDDATDGQLYAVIYSLPESVQRVVTDGEYLPVDLPVGLPSTGAAVPFIPLDAIFQSEDKAIVYVVKDGKAQARTLNLGNVLGGFVEVISGLQAGDQIILDRNVIEGDQVKVIGY